MLQECQSYPMTKRGRESSRGHDTLITLRNRRGIGGQKMCASSQSFCRIERLKADDAHAVRIRKRWPICQDAPDIVFFCGHHSAKAEVTGSGATVHLVARDVPFLNAHDAQSFCAISRDIVARARLHQHPRKRLTVARRNADFISELSRKRNAVEPCR